MSCFWVRDLTATCCIWCKITMARPVLWFQVKVEGRTQFLSAVCMSCLEGSGGQPVRCRFCTQPWDGSSLVLGTMYSYDIFAAMPCCSERLKVSSEFVTSRSDQTLTLQLTSVDISLRATIRSLVFGCKKFLKTLIV